MDFSMNIVIADENEAEDIGQSSWPLEDWQGIESKDIDLLKIATLHSVLTSQNFDEAMEEYAPVYTASEDGPWVTLFPEDAVEKLSELNEDALYLVAEELAATEEFEISGWPAEAVQDLLTELAELARVAVEEGKSLFVWISQ